MNRVDPASKCKNWKGDAVATKTWSPCPDSDVMYCAVSLLVVSVRFYAIVILTDIINTRQEVHMARIALVGICSSRLLPETKICRSKHLQHVGRQLWAQTLADVGTQKHRRCKTLDDVMKSVSCNCLALLTSSICVVFAEGHVESAKISSAVFDSVGNVRYGNRCLGWDSMVSKWTLPVSLDHFALLCGFWCFFRLNCRLCKCWFCWLCVEFRWVWPHLHWFAGSSQQKRWLGQVCLSVFFMLCCECLQSKLVAFWSPQMGSCRIGLFLCCACRNNFLLYPSARDAKKWAKNKVLVVSKKLVKQTSKKHKKRIS